LLLEVQEPSSVAATSARRAAAATAYINSAATKDMNQEQVLATANP